MFSVCIVDLMSPIADGIDFFFATKGEAKKLVDFLMNVAPCRCAGH